MDGKKIISIVIPVFNASRDIERALASFISNREFIKEVILVDDGTTDDTFEKIAPFEKFYRIILLKNFGQKGPGPARRTGLCAASGEWVTFVDTDDALTGSSLYYINKKIEEFPEANLIKGKTISYESGEFSSELRDTVGGYFYRREYLVRNNLLPHKSLFMAEDSYFMDLVQMHIIKCDDLEETIIDFNYPVYEVHHDMDEHMSFACKRWVLYSIKYHLQCRIYITERFLDCVPHEELFESFAINFIFCFHMLEDSLSSTEWKCNRYEEYRYFKNALEFLENTFGKTTEDVIKFYNTTDREALLQCAYESAGIFTPFLSFEKFIRSVSKLKKGEV